MPSKTDVLDAIVIGAGWAGLGVSHALLCRGLRHRVLERNRIGETWRTQRWDSFRMNSPNAHTVMPGDRYEGPDPWGVLTRDEFVLLLDSFAKRHELPVDVDTPVTELTDEREIDAYCVTTPRGTLWARNVVIASGSQNCPKRPQWATALPAGLHQIDASDYRNADRLPPGAILVVGNAQSGGQIAEDLAEARRTVFLATGKVGRVPRRYRDQDIGFWLVTTGLFDVPRKELVQPSGRIAARPLLGALHTISLQSLSAQGVKLLGRFTGVDGNGRLSFADDLEEHIRFADEVSATIKGQIDAYIARAGIDAPAAEPDPAETVAARLPKPPIRSLDPVTSGITTVIWCVGFQGDFGWVRLPGVLDEERQPVHEKGVAAVPGLYFAGLDFGSTRKSPMRLTTWPNTSLVVVEPLSGICGGMSVLGQSAKSRGGIAMSPCHLTPDMWIEP
jgi:putative flavoprotein involved in K+ transport